MDSYQPTQEQFLRDVAKHRMRIVRDDGLYRHLRLSSGSFNMQFDVLTWPGYLCYTGDMGTWVFTRIEDMFAFFRGVRINPCYWSEKIESQDRSTGTKAFSQEAFKAEVLDSLDGWDLDKDALGAVVCELQDEVFCHDNPFEAIRALYDFKSEDGRVEFNDDLPDGMIYTRRYIWCCRAIVWAIEQYDKGQHG
jgi:hypothetical protein